jgi:hypothetical protein
MALSIMTFSITLRKCDTQHNDTRQNGIQCICQMLLCWALFILNVKYKSILLSVIIVSVFMLNVVVPLICWVIIWSVVRLFQSSAKFILVVCFHPIEIKLDCRWLQKCFLIWNYYVGCLWAPLLVLTQSQERVFWSNLVFLTIKTRFWQYYS